MQNCLAMLNGKYISLQLTNYKMLTKWQIFIKYPRIQIGCFWVYFARAWYKNKKVNRFEINFINEILYAEEVSIFACELESSDFRFEIRKNGTTACKARIVMS